MTTTVNPKRKGKSGQKRSVMRDTRHKADKLSATRKNEIKARLRFLNLRLEMLKAHTIRLANDLRQTGRQQPPNSAQTE